MINIGILLDACGITYSETKLLKLETLVNDLIKKLLEKNSSDIDHFTICDDPVKEEIFDDNILEIKDDPLIEPKENPLEIRDDLSNKHEENILEIRNDIPNEPIESDFRKYSEVEPVFKEQRGMS